MVAMSPLWFMDALPTDISGLVLRSIAHHGSDKIGFDDDLRLVRRHGGAPRSVVVCGFAMNAGCACRAWDLCDLDVAVVVGILGSRF